MASIAQEEPRSRRAQMCPDFCDLATYHDSCVVVAGAIGTQMSGSSGGPLGRPRVGRATLSHLYYREFSPDRWVPERMFVYHPADESRHKPARSGVSFTSWALTYPAVLEILVP